MPDLLADGLYFDLPEDDYHADPALGSTALKAIHTNPVDYQEERLFGERTVSKAMVFGKAVHAYTLEGLQEYRDRFKVAPVESDFEDLMVTIPHMRDEAARMDLRLKSSLRKHEIVAALREAGCELPIWDEILEKFQLSLQGASEIDREMHERVIRAVSWMERHSKLGVVMEKGTFTKGASEVSYIYTTEEGVRLCCRFDYLYPTLLLDLKTYAPWESAPLRKQVRQTIMKRRYDLQAGCYLMAFDDMRQKALEKKLVVHGNEPYDGYVDALMTTERMQWYWVMVRSIGAPAPTLVQLSPTSFALSGAIADMREAVEIYRTYRDRFGDDKPWSPPEDVIDIDDTDFPAYFGR